MEKKKQENKMRRDQLNDEYLELLDKQRLYFKTVKDFKEVRRTRALSCCCFGSTGYTVRPTVHCQEHLAYFKAMLSNG